MDLFEDTSATWESLFDEQDGTSTIDAGSIGIRPDDSGRATGGPNVRILVDGGAPVMSAERQLRRTAEQSGIFLGGPVECSTPKSSKGDQQLPSLICEEDAKEIDADLLYPEYITHGVSGRSAHNEVFRTISFDRKQIAIQTVHRIGGVVHPGNRFLEELGANKKSTGGGLIVWTHTNDYGPHFHIVHGCNFQGNRCQCFKSGGWLAKFGSPIGKPLCYSGSRLDQKHWKNLWLHCTEGEGRRALLLCQPRRLGPYKLCGIQNLPPLWEGPFPLQGSGECECFVDDQCGKGTVDCPSSSGAGEVRLQEARNQAPPRVRTVAKAVKALAEKAEKHWIGDFALLMDLAEVRIDEDLQYVLGFHMDAVQKYMNNHFMLHYFKIKNMKFNDIRQHLTTCPAAFSDGFMGIEESLSALKHIFNTQFGEDAPRYVVSFRKWFDQTLGKKNTIIIIGPPSCGKTWLASAFTRLGCYFGKILEWTKGSQFSFGGCQTGRVILHDECIQPIEGLDYLETLKKIYAGEKNVPINVKYREGALACGAPVIGTSNSHPIRNGSVREAFEARVNFINFQHDEILNEMITGQCNPRALFDLWDWAFDILCESDPSLIIEFCSDVFTM